MTSPNTGLRRTALVVLAVGAALGASACSAGQVSQTASQVAAVDGGQGSVGDLYVNDLVVELPDEGEARVGFTASFSGYTLDEAISLDRVEIDGTQIALGETQPMDRGCSLVVLPGENAAPKPVPEDVCVEQTTATLPAADDLAVGTSVPATVSFSNGDQIEMQAAIIAPTPEAGEYTRPAEYVGEPEGH